MTRHDGHGEAAFDRTFQTVPEARYATSTPSADAYPAGTPSADAYPAGTPSADAYRASTPPGSTPEPQAHSVPAEAEHRHGHTAQAEQAPGHAEGSHARLSLLPPEGRDALALRMQQAVTDFVEDPRQAVEEADSAFDRIVTELTEALDERRRALRSSWQGPGNEARTEELRVALQHYRDAGEQLLRI
ncbi:hypothetical protein [Streptomyces nitrosporeus]|uniref:hypothetical protein n=1 Tax=Streptomyces nitrosporeus TaxID=28894 RepID=UPI0039A2519D